MSSYLSGLQRARCTVYVVDNGDVIVPTILARILPFGAFLILVTQRACLSFRATSFRPVMVRNIFS
jgi:hypothetical protein